MIFFQNYSFRSEQKLPTKEKNYRAILRLNSHLITEKRVERIEKTSVHRKLSIVTEKIRFIILLTNDFESSNQKKITRVPIPRVVKYSNWSS